MRSSGLSGRVTIRFRDAQVYRGESRSGLRRSGLSGRVTIRFRDAQVYRGVTIRFEKLRFIGESHDQVRDAQVYRGESRSGLRSSGLSGRVTIGSRRSGLSVTVTIGFETLRFIGDSHDQV